MRRDENKTEQVYSDENISRSRENYMEFDDNIIDTSQPSWYNESNNTASINDSASSTNSARKCADCKKPPHMQCLHCSKYVCMECAQKHVSLATEQIDVAQHVLNDKMSIIDRLSAAAKERVNADRNKIIKQTDVERDQAFAQIDQIAEQQKKLIRNKSGQLIDLSLDEIPAYIKRMTNEMEHINETNNQLFLVNTTLPKIQVQTTTKRSK